MAYKTLSGLVLKRQPLQEADEIITLWSWEHGKVRLVVRGLRRDSSKLKAAVLPLAWMEYQIVAHGQLPLVVGAKTVRSYAQAGSSLHRAALVFSVFELILQTTPDQEPNYQLSQLLRASLEYLDRQDSIQADFFVIFRLRLLAALGYALNLTHCASCGILLGTSPESWSLHSMGLLCTHCQTVAENLITVDRQCYSYIESLQRHQDFFPNLGGLDECQQAADRWLDQVLVYITERGLQSGKFLYQVAEI